MQYRIGIDVGTTNVKAAAFDEAGGLAAYAAVPTPVLHPAEGFSEFEPEAMWRAVCASARAVARDVGAGLIGSVGISSMAEAGVPLDRGGRPLHNFIAWYDMRSQAQCDRLVCALGADRIYRITGQIATAKLGLTKLMWIKAMHPDVCACTAHWLSMEDYMLFRLTGEMATDYSVASRTMAFDIHKLDWSAEILAAAEIDPGIFPHAVPGGTRIGAVSGAAAANCGLTRGTPVSAGGHDHASAAVAVNILEEGVVLDSMGTSEVTMVAMDCANLTQKSMAAHYSIYPHCGRRLYRALTSNQASGLAVDWFLQTFCPDMIQRERAGGASRYDLLFREMRMDPDRHDGLFFLPMIRGTAEQPGMRGGFLGIADLHDRGDFIAAMTDGPLYEVRRQIEGYCRAFGQAGDKVRVVGGASKSAPLMQRKADVLGARVQVPLVTEAACMGAAMLGAVGAGQLSIDELGSAYRPGPEYAPDPFRARRDGARFKQYESLRRLAMAGDLAWRKEAFGV